jgi:chromosome segregation protein
MYIKSIKMQGFKSFADKTELDFDKNICAIVGPNGSGKSNVVDALLWVLGEQSVKTLRGDDKMSDIIFSGSKSREGLTKASVSILFDNEDHTLPSEFGEVEIKRTIYKTGENEYFINNSRVRLKDITDLILDVSSKFNIITQGNINALVDNKSSERRVLFENAAGVLKYKKRKEETLKKLDKTNENLTRVKDIIKELEEQIEPLKIQSEKANKYLKIKENLEQIEIALIANDLEKLNVLYHEQTKQIEDLTNEIIEKTTNITNDDITVKLQKEHTWIVITEIR